MPRGFSAAGMTKILLDVKKIIRMPNDVNSLACMAWNCKYHIVAALKYGKAVFFGEKREAIGKILRQLCEWKSMSWRSVQIRYICW